eukprot:2759580-Prymnesium_polylepis.1
MYWLTTSITAAPGRMCSALRMSPPCIATKTSARRSSVMPCCSDSSTSEAAEQLTRSGGAI